MGFTDALTFQVKKNQPFNIVYTCAREKIYIYFALLIQNIFLLPCLLSSKNENVYLKIDSIWKANILCWYSFRNLINSLLSTRKWFQKFRASEKLIFRYISKISEMYRFMKFLEGKNVFQISQNLVAVTLYFRKPSW